MSSRAAADRSSTKKRTTINLAQGPMRSFGTEGKRLTLSSGACTVDHRIPLGAPARAEIRRSLGPLEPDLGHASVGKWTNARERAAAGAGVRAYACRRCDRRSAAGSGGTSREAREASRSANTTVGRSVRGGFFFRSSGIEPRDGAVRERRPNRSPGDRTGPPAPGTASRDWHPIFDTAWAS